MKAITLWQPWASAISFGWKTIETRRHNRLKSLVGQRIAIHAGQQWDPNAFDLWREADPENFGEKNSRLHKLVDAFLDQMIERGSVTEADLQHPDAKPLLTSGIERKCFPMGMVVCTAHVLMSAPLSPSLFDLEQETATKKALCPLQDGMWGLWLEDVDPMEPVPAKGHQGIWEWEG